jgi:hypothetical protein
LPLWATYASFIGSAAHIKSSSTPAVTGVKFRQANLGSFSISDLKRLKDNDNWLSDSHVSLGLQ